MYLPILCIKYIESISKEVILSLFFKEFFQSFIDVVFKILVVYVEFIYL